MGFKGSTSSGSKFFVIMLSSVRLLQLVRRVHDGGEERAAGVEPRAQVREVLAGERCQVERPQLRAPQDTHQPLAN